MQTRRSNYNNITYLHQLFNFDEKMKKKKTKIILPSFEPMFVEINIIKYCVLYTLTNDKKRKKTKLWTKTNVCCLSVMNKFLSVYEIV